MDIINLNGEIYVQISFLKKYGLNSNTVYNGLSRNRKNNCRSYIHFADTKDKRIKWIKYTSIPSQVSKKYQLPSSSALLESLENNDIEAKENLIHRCLFFAYENGYNTYKKHYNGVFHDIDSINRYSKTHAVFISILDLRNNGIPLNSIFNFYLKLDDLVFETKSLKSFYHKIKDFEIKGSDSLIHKSYGKKRPHKIADVHLKKLEELYRNSKIYSGREIHRKINLWAVIEGYTELSFSSVKKILADPDFKNRNKGYRYGKEWVFNNFKPFKTRESPAYNGTQWQLDGSRLQIPYLGQNNFPRFLILFVVMDVHSRKIIGYSFDDSENNKVVIEALKMAVNNTKYLPREILRDNGKCFSHKKVKYIEEYFSFLGSNIRKHSIGLARDKAHVERFFSTFQTTVLNKVDGYIGEGIKSRREEGRPSRELILKSLKKDQLRSRIELETLIPNLINKYNSQKLNEDKPSPQLMYELAKKDEDAINISENEFSLIFWDKTRIKVKNSMILMSEGGNRKQRFQYIIHDEKLSYSLNLTEVQVIYQKEDRSIIKIFDSNDKWITNLSIHIPLPVVRKKAKTKNRTLPTKSETIDQVAAKDKKQKLSDLNQIYKQEATLERFFIKSKSNE